MNDLPFIKSCLLKVFITIVKFLFGLSVPLTFLSLRRFDEDPEKNIRKRKNNETKAMNNLVNGDNFFSLLEYEELELYDEELLDGKSSGFEVGSEL